MDTTINNASALLDECLTNGDVGPLTLYTWFKDAKESIEVTIKELKLTEWG